MYTYKNLDTGVVITVPSEITASHWEEVKAPVKKPSSKKGEKKED